MSDNLVSYLKFRASGGDGPARRLLARIEALEAAGNRMADMLEAVTVQLRSWGHDPAVNVDGALAAWRAVEGGGDE